MATICICGAGTMGSGIAQVAAASGFDAVLYDLNETVLEKAKEKLDKDLQQLVERQKLTAEKSADIMQRLRFTTNIDVCVADVVIEAVIEKPEVKTALFNRLAKLNQPDTIFATNTSSLSVTEIAAAVEGADRVAGMHFFNPAPVMKLVEIVRGEQTSEATVEKLVALTQQMGKVPVLCKDAPGFIVNRVARPYYIESLRLAEQKIADIETIDRLLENAGFKMGPFRLMDLIGNDVNYAVSTSVYRQLHEPERLRPSYLQQEKVEKGELGRKTGKGFYTY